MKPPKGTRAHCTECGRTWDDPRGHTRACLAHVKARITNYLSVGGLFNPELMEHTKVRDLLIDARDALTASDARGEGVKNEG